MGRRLFTTAAEDVSHLVGTEADLALWLTDAEHTARARLGETAWWWWFLRGWHSGQDAE